MTNLIFVEGADGTGKTSCAKGIVAALISKGKSAIYIPIIEGSSVGKDYRSDYVSGKTVPITEALGMLYSVSKTLLDVVAPSQKLYDYVIVDRSLASFFTYQICTNGYEWMENPFYEVESSTPRGRTVYLTVDPTKALERMMTRGVPLDVIEQRGAKYQRHIASSYQECFNYCKRLRPTVTIPTDSFTLEEVVVRALSGLEL